MVRGTRVLPLIADHLSDHHPALRQNQVEEQRSVERRLWDTNGRSILDLEDQRGLRRGHNTEDQFDPEETENNSTTPTLRSKEGHVAEVPEAEEVSNSIVRRGQEERTVKNPSPLKY
ncbi:hypothetical protein TNCV_2901841 [Trichonephila clavipes]|nr:hypothetical protein TNCV_2901841 [Trichonephila clavipes]